MKCIRTTYRGPGNVRGARIFADDGDGNRVSISYPYELNRDAGHVAAAQALCDKMGWKGQRVVGWHRDCAYHVFIEIEVN